MFRPSKTGGYNVLCEHTILTLPLMTDIMPRDTAFVTSVREPMAYLKSALNYYKVYDVASINCSDPFTEFLRDPAKYDSIFKTRGRPRKCVPARLSVTKNSMAFDLGFSTGYRKGTVDQTKNSTFIDEWVHNLDNIFDIVLIVEYFQESIVLMRRTFGWNIKDVIYIRRNSGAVKAVELVDTQLVRTYKTWSRVDYRLYNHFNRTLWRKIADEGFDFWNELEYFKNVVNQTNTFCQSIGRNKAAILHFAPTAWSDSFNISIDDCKVIGRRLIKELKKQYDDIDVEVVYERQTGQRCW